MKNGDKCSVPGCGEPFHARGFCKKHHKSAIRSGQLVKRSSQIDVIDELISFCPTTGCWLWGGTSDRLGYGYLMVGREKTFAHRYFKGVSDPSIHVCHSCDTPACVNPDHLFLGSQADNMADMMKKGRHYSPRGEKHPKAKITNEQATEARMAFLNGESRRSISERTGLGYRSICLLLQGKTWNVEV